MNNQSTITSVSGKKEVERVLNARRDTLDFRDRMFEPTLIEVPTHWPLEGEQGYLRHKIPILDQGAEGACTGFGLATVANYLLTVRRVIPDNVPVSARMLYVMARRYDEWPGEEYSGSSARGAMKGWHKHGVCSKKDWDDGETEPLSPAGLTRARTTDALRRPLGAYQRVNHKDLVAMHCALAEVGILYATAVVHDGWSQVGKSGEIAWPSGRVTGGHAFAIVAYDAEGFWIQNSWDTDWGKNGFARISYDDWLANGTDVWVARLGAPVVLREHQSAAIAHSASAGRSVAYSFADLRPHIVSLGNGGKLQAGGNFGSSEAEVARIFDEEIEQATEKWPVRHVLLYAHGGLVAESNAVQRLADYRSTMLDAHVYPISFIWHSDFWNTVRYMLEDALRNRRPEGVLSPVKDFLLDRLDDTLEVLLRVPGKAAWDEMKENAIGATSGGGGAMLALQRLVELRKKLPFHLHIVGHSAGSIFHGPVVRWLARQGQTIDTCTLWAPAVTMEGFKKDYLPAIKNDTIGKFNLFALNDQIEQDDNCALMYNKSLLYLVSRSFENGAFGEGTPLLGMARWIEKSAELKKLVEAGKAEVILSPNALPEGDPSAARSQEHGDFDDDTYTVLATLKRVIGSADFAKYAAGVSPAPIRTQKGGARAAAIPGSAAGAGVAAKATPPQELNFHRSSSSLRARREEVDRLSTPRSAS